VREPTLDDVFLELTGHRTDDGDDSAPDQPPPDPTRPLAQEGVA
jgi:hypothetical protein